MAILNKQKAIFIHKIRIDRGHEVDQAKLEEWLGKALTYYAQVSPGYLNGKIQITYRYYDTGIRKTSKSRNSHFLHPDHSMDGWFSTRYNSALWVKYILDKGKLETLYPSTGELEFFNNWLSDYLEIYPNGLINCQNYIEIPTSLLERLLAAIQSHPNHKGFDFNLLNLLLTNRRFKAGSTAGALERFNALDLPTLSVTANRWQYLNFTSIYNEMVTLAIHLGSTGKHQEAIQVIQSLPDLNYRAAVFSKVAGSLYQRSFTEKSFIYLDSAFQNRKLIDDNALGIFDYRYYMINALSKIGGNELNQISTNILTNMPDNKKPGGIIQYVTGLAFEGNYFSAWQSITYDLSVTNELECLNQILASEINYTSGGDTLSGWEGYDAFSYHLTNYIVFNNNF